MIKKTEGHNLPDAFGKRNLLGAAGSFLRSFSWSYPEKGVLSGFFDSEIEKIKLKRALKTLLTGCGQVTIIILNDVHIEVTE